LLMQPIRARVALSTNERYMSMQYQIASTVRICRKSVPATGDLPAD
jgi:hypothetical protein